MKRDRGLHGWRAAISRASSEKGTVSYFTVLEGGYYH